jgi:subtilisin family serine protease
VRCFDDAGLASAYGMMQSVDFALTNGARVISLSWGSETYSGFLESVFEHAAAHDVAVVAAAGNEPTGKSFYPAAHGSVLAVSATLPDGRPWPRSNYGDFVDLSAPGFALMPDGTAQGGAYAGTSVSSAFVAGILGQYLTAHPAATVEQAVETLRRSLSKAEATDTRYGAGVLDAAAVDRFLNTPP